MRINVVERMYHKHVNDSVFLNAGLHSLADEILKSAVMKYGKNQWGRIASLLVKKSPKQCKARWYEWLDPSIKKTEWTREEDEKLLHLAKLMPQQWRSIAPIVGRTAHQCLERYEKLIDTASAQSQGATSSQQQQQQQSNPRKLKPGEIDPAPETKPAKPDAVDMDEEEKEMLNEARARLANTQGKKAKRKARERQLEEARRLANLQKKRELKAAGLESAINRRRHKGGIDYGTEIPFKKDPPKGFFDTSEEEEREKEKSRGEFKPTTIQELEGIKRKDIEKSVMEAKTKQQELDERNNAPAALAQAEQANDVDMSQRRGRLTLPPPQVSENEMDEIAKLGKQSGIYTGGESSGSDATAGLVANYLGSQTPGLSSARTPSEDSDAVMQEAENLSKLQAGETPLAGGKNPDLHPTDFSGVTPQRTHARTPNPQAQATVQHTPGQTPRSVASTPASQREGQQASSGSTPFRDSFGINAEDSQSVLGNKRKRKEHLSSLRKELTSLPEPTKEYQKVLPDVPDEPAAQEPIAEDAEEQEKRLKEEERKREEAEWKRQSTVVQRHLPRPAPGSKMSTKEYKNDDLIEAQKFIAEEAAKMVRYDHVKYPTAKSKTRNNQVANDVHTPELSRLEDADISVARDLIEEEAPAGSSPQPPEPEHMDKIYNDLVLDRDIMQWKVASKLNEDELAKHRAAEFDSLKKLMEKDGKRAAKQERRPAQAISKLQNEANELKSAISSTKDDADELQRQLEAFQALKTREDGACTERLQSLRDEVNHLQQVEKQLQKQYAALQQ